jgi:hypothetical protein
LFADIKGSTALMRDLDPEEVGAIIAIESGKEIPSEGDQRSIKRLVQILSATAIHRVAQDYCP